MHIHMHVYSEMMMRTAMMMRILENAPQLYSQPHTRAHNPTTGNISMLLLKKIMTKKIPRNTHRFHNLNPINTSLMRLYHMSVCDLSKQKYCH